MSMKVQFYRRKFMLAMSHNVEFKKLGSLEIVFVILYAMKVNNLLSFDDVC